MTGPRTLSASHPLSATRTLTLEAPGATLTYDVHGDVASADPEHGVLLVGSPMAAADFGALASAFTDRPVVTYDPRGAGRSVRTDDTSQTTPQQHADDVRRVVEAVGVGPVDLFATSGGAVNALALVAERPDLVRTLVAHEPPLAEYLPDRAQVLAVNAAIGETYRRDGFGPAMARFIALVMVEDPLPEDFPTHPAPDPAAYGLPSEDDGRRDDPLLGLNNATCVSYVPDLQALAGAATDVVVAVGVQSRRQLAGRAAVGLARALGTTPVMFPSHHSGFVGDSPGQPGEPEAFAARLREVLAGARSPLLS